MRMENSKQEILFVMKQRVKIAVAIAILNIAPQNVPIEYFVKQIQRNAFLKKQSERSHLAFSLMEILPFGNTMIERFSIPAIPSSQITCENMSMDVDSNWSDSEYESCENRARKNQACSGNHFVDSDIKVIWRGESLNGNSKRIALELYEELRSECEFLSSIFALKSVAKNKESMRVDAFVEHISKIDDCSSRKQLYDSGYSTSQNSYAHIAGYIFEDIVCKVEVEQLILASTKKILETLSYEAEREDNFYKFYALWNDSHLMRELSKLIPKCLEFATSSIYLEVCRGSVKNYFRSVARARIDAPTEMKEYCRMIASLIEYDETACVASVDIILCAIKKQSLNVESDLIMRNNQRVNVYSRNLFYLFYSLCILVESYFRKHESAKYARQVLKWKAMIAKIKNDSPMIPEIAQYSRDVLLSIIKLERKSRKQKNRFETQGGRSANH